MQANPSTLKRRNYIVKCVIIEVFPMGLNHDVKHTKDKSASKCAAMTADFNLESKANGKTPLQRGRGN